MEQLFDDLEDFGSFDDAISGDVRDPYTELARLRREEPVQRLEMSGALPHEERLPMFIVYRHEDVQQMLRDNETFSSAAVIAAFGPVLGEGVMLGMDEPSTAGCVPWSRRRSRRSHWRAGRTSWSAGWQTA